MKTAVSILTLVLALPGESVAGCDPEGARSLSERHMAAYLSADCEQQLTGISASPSWIQLCRRGLLPPNEEAKAEFAERTTFRFSKLEQRGPNWIALGVLKGPDPIAFELALSDQGFCGATWTLYRSEGQECGVDWSNIPEKSYEGLVPIACDAGRWVVRDLE